MPVRLGIDVGGTFTKAAAIDVATGEVVARAVVPTSHTAPNGIAVGVVAVLREAATLIEREGRGPIVMVGHSTTGGQPLEATCRGSARGHRLPDLGPARKRTNVRRLTRPKPRLEPTYRFIDATDGLPEARVEAIVDKLIAAGVETLAVSEAFAIEDPSVSRPRRS
jgi:N-methylhydantoinase A/oxoprolinase/acetone carboxylase beta subunit